MNSSNSPKAWAEISIDGPSFILETLAEFFNSIGARGAIFSSPQNKKPGYESITCFIPHDKKFPAKLAKLRKYLAELSRLFPDHQLSEPRIQIIKDTDWINQWRETVVPTKVSKKFWVVPEWRKPPKEALKPGYRVIIMEPGLAFGTGYHPTTRLCLEMIEELVPERARTVLDVGTGTGILAMASAMLGAKSVLAIDIDPLSLEVANDNLQRNKLKSRVRLQLVKENSALRLGRKKFELILANLFEAELKKLAEDFAKHLKNKGYLAISGILPEQASPLMKVYKKLGMRILQKKEQNKWIAILMRKN